MDPKSLNIWLEKIWKPHVAICETSVLLLVGLSCHNQEIFVRLLRLTGTFTEYISTGCTCILQPCDVGVMKFLSCVIKKNTRRAHRQNIFT